MKTFLFPVLLMSAAFSFANEAADDRMNRASFESQLTRSAVQAEFLQARAEGTLPDTSETGAMFAQIPQSDRSVAGHQLTRAQVHAEYLRARAEGTLPDTSETGSMFASQPVTGPGRARAEVYAEAVQAARGGIVH